MFCLPFDVQMLSMSKFFGEIFMNTLCKEAKVKENDGNRWLPKLIKIYAWYASKKKKRMKKNMDILRFAVNKFKCQSLN